MTEQEMMRVNKAAAELLGLKGQTVQTRKVSNGELVSEVAVPPYINIFKSPADCLAVVKKLGEGIHAVSIIRSCDCHDAMDQHWSMQSLDGEVYFYCYTFEDAVAAAVLEVSGE